MGAVGVGLGVLSYGFSKFQKAESPVFSASQVETYANGCYLLVHSEGPGKDNSKIKKTPAIVKGSIHPPPPGKIDACF